MSGISKFKRIYTEGVAAQREETENIYNYIIETLVDADFAESYEAAENIFEHMSDEFTAVILEEYLEERKRSRTERKAANAGKKGYDKEGKPVPTGKPRVYDFDKVTADTAGTMVHIKNAEGKRVQSLNDTEFYTHHKNKELKPGHSYDYSDFDSPKVLAKNAKPIKSTIASMKRDQKRNKPVMTLTARSHKVKSGVTDFLNKHGVSASKVKQHFTGDMPSHLNTGERKAITLKHIVKNNPAGAKFTDDHPGNLESAKEVPKVKTFLAKPNKKGKVVSRSYQATKEEMSTYDYWKQFINEDSVNEDLATGLAGMAARRGVAKLGGKVASKFIPGFQQASAVGDTISDLRKGDWGRAALSAGQAIPGPAGWGFTAARLAAGEKEEAKPAVKPATKPVKPTATAAKPTAKPATKPAVATKPVPRNTLSV